MRLAALYDIHGNLPALEAVLEEVRAAHVDLVVVGGDIVPGPMPCETLERLLDLDLPVRFIGGNGERAVMAQLAAGTSGKIAYWGTASGQPPPEPVQAVLRWTAWQLRPRHTRTIRHWPATMSVEHPAVGRVLFCHGTPRSETETFTRLTPEDRLRPVFGGLDAALVVCGHTHMPFDRMIAGSRVINAGSVGMPFGRPGADWLLLGEDVQVRHTAYDLAAAAARVRATRYPQAEEFAARSILRPPLEEEMLDALTSSSF